MLYKNRNVHGKRQTFPSPTEYPRRESKKSNCPLHVPRSGCSGSSFLSLLVEDNNNSCCIVCCSCCCDDTTLLSVNWEFWSYFNVCLSCSCLKKQFLRYLRLRFSFFAYFFMITFLIRYRLSCFIDWILFTFIIHPYQLRLQV